MAQPVLNLGVLRRRPHLSSPSDPSDRGGKGGLTAPEDAPGRDGDLSRRTLLGLAGAATVGLSPAARAIETAALGRYRLEHDRQRAMFSLGTGHVWTLDARRFGGRPSLEVDRTGGEVRLTLSGALFPGTQIPADLVCRLAPGTLATRMEIAFGLCDLRVTAAFEPWLAGLEKARGVLRRAARAEVAGDGSTLALAARGAATFGPDWILTLEGTAVGELALGGPAHEVRLPGDRIELALLAAGTPSLVGRPAPKRCLVTIERGDSDWDAGVLLPAPPAGRLACASASASLVHVESGCDDNVSKTAALLVELDALTFAPAAGLATPDGEVLQIPLEDVRYGRVLSGAGAGEAALSARFAPRAVWLAAGDTRLQIGGRSRASEERFELLGTAEGFREIRCQPRLFGILAPLAGGSAGLMRPRAEARLAFAGLGRPGLLAPAEATAGGTQQRRVTPRVIRPQTQPEDQATSDRPTLDARPRAMDRAVLTIADDRLTRLRLPSNLIVSVLRSRDFLALDFEFVNLRLEASAPRRLVRSDAAKPAYVIVHFPPQSVYEQAFYEVSGSSDGVDSDGKPVPSESGGSERLPTPPVHSRLSGPSRLSFRLPRIVNELPYTLEGLLEACLTMPLAVGRNARPPDPPVRSGQLTRALALLSGATATRGTVGRAPAGTARAISGSRRGAASTGSAAARLRQPGNRMDSTATSTAAPGAIGLVAGPPAEPTPVETAIEMPYRLILSPHGKSAWSHSVDTGPSQEGSGRHELWHTRLAVRAGDGSADERNRHYRSVRAIWSPDYNAARPPDHQNLPFRSTLDARDRHEVVALSSDFSMAGWKPLPIAVERLMLTSLGAWLDSRGAWEPPGSLEVEEWKHRATMARDHYVRVVYKGYLFPFRHRASLIKVTQRKFQKIQDGPQAGQIAAFLRQRMFIVVREPELTYDYAVASGGARWERENPFKRVRITTLTTPDLLDPNSPECEAAPGFGQQGFWPKTASGRFAFHLVAWDWQGRKSDFSAPLIFVGASRASKKSDLDAIQGGYDAETDGGEPTAQTFFDGQKIAYAAPKGASDENTALESDSLTFTSRNHDAAAGEPGFFPALSEAEVRIPAVDALTGGGQASRIEYSPVYVDNGFAAPTNVSEIFVQIKGDSGTPLRFDGDRSGGVATPNLNIAGLSRRFGPVGGPFSSPPDLSELAGGNFDPQKYFEGAAAKILGGIPLADIISKQFGDGKNVPKMSTELVYPGGDESKLPEATRAELLWEPDVIDDPTGTFTKRSGTKFRLNARITQRFDAVGQEPDTVVEGELTDFDINLIPVVTTFLVVTFKSFSFRSESGKKMEVDPQIQTVEFAGPLMFVNELKDYLSAAGMSIDIGPQGVEAGYSVGLPAITAGVMNLQNISLSAGLSIPFTGDPVRLKFGFCERENPFLLTVYCFGGGGFVGLAVGLDGVELLEIALEFGANASLDIGVASGGVYIMAGIYIAVEGDECALTGYLRMGGALEILGIITLSLEFYMSLTYESKGNKVWGEATLTVEIEIAFVSVPVEMSVRREFTDPELPKFSDMMTDGEWTEYCEAFAA